ncbi:uncharacterized protein LOC141830333 [Curcuma longa]|uniref:uncharacterized protein LOC141830333 n=1 Tax=Curcuma longa TaxID=136217 RepID=UPI003D9E4746
MGTTVKKTMICFLVICLASQALTRAMARGLEAGAAADSKAYYSPPTTSPHHSHGGSSSPSTNPPSTGGDAPASHGSPPSGGGGGGYYSPPSTGGDAPASHGSPPSGGDAPASHGSPPSGGGGGYYSPPSSTPVPSPPSSTPVVVHTPSSPSTTPVVVPPGTPLTPVDPNCPPFTCDYWRSHPNAIWALFGFWCPVAQIFGLPNPMAFATTNPTVMDALANTRRDGIGELYREATAAFLNSLADRHFYFTGQQVRDSFRAAVGSDREASAQAQLFKQANEGRLKRG